MQTATVPPLKFRRVRAAMQLKCLTLQDLTSLTGIDVSTVSRVLSNHPVAEADKKFAAIKDAVEKAPMPKEAA
jgi:transcriptional regulator with XRE-family HTH domain